MKWWVGPLLPGEEKEDIKFVGWCGVRGVLKCKN